MSYLDYVCEQEARAALNMLKYEGYTGYVVVYNASWSQVRYWA
jgi:hypothetical protein